jgi:hypothetical protein
MQYSSAYRNIESLKINNSLFIDLHGELSTSELELVFRSGKDPANRFDLRIEI